MMAVLLGLSLVTAMSAGPAFAADKMPAFKNNKQMVEYFWNQVFNKHNTSVIDSMTAPNYTRVLLMDARLSKMVFRDSSRNFPKAKQSSNILVLMETSCSSITILR